MTKEMYGTTCEEVICDVPLQAHDGYPARSFGPLRRTSLPIACFKRDFDDKGSSRNTLVYRILLQNLEYTKSYQI